MTIADRLNDLDAILEKRKGLNAKHTTIKSKRPGGEEDPF